MLCPTHTCHQSPIYHRGLLNGLCPTWAYHHALIYHWAMPTCHHAPIYHRGLLLPSFAHIPLGPYLRCSVQSSHIIMHPHTTGASWTLLCLIPPAIMQPYTTGAFCCHHSPIIHRGLVSGALSKAHISSCTPIPPGPVGHCFASSHMPSCRHIPPGPSERHCFAQRTPAIMHPHTTGAL